MKHETINKAPKLEVYTTYTFEDFLLDDYFLLSVRKPSCDSIQFWNEFVELKSNNLIDYNQAICYIESLSDKSERLSEEEVFEIWKNIEIANKEYLKQSFNRQQFKFIFIAASVLIAVMLSWPFLNNLNKKEDSSLMSFVKQSMISNEGEVAQLILSDTEIIDLPEQESEINYRENRIEVNQQKESALELPESKDSFNQIVVPKGKRVTLNLSDGSRIWINSGTKVIYPAHFDKSKREIYVDGEVYAEIARNEECPFVVKTSTIDVEVLGTTFNVNAYQSDAEQSVVLVSGSVKVLSENKKILLKPNEKYQNSQGKEQVEHVNVEFYTSWINGLFVYESERLDVIAKRLSKYYSVDIECSEEASSLRFSGKLDLKEDLSAILSGMQKTAPIKLEQVEGKYQITLNH